MVGNSRRIAAGLILAAGAAMVLMGVAHHASADTYWTVGVPSTSGLIGPPQATTNVAVTYYGGSAIPPIISMYSAAATTPAPVQTTAITSGSTGLFHYDDQLQGSQISSVAVYSIVTPGTTGFEVSQVSPADSNTKSVDGTRLIPEREFGKSYTIGQWQDPYGGAVCALSCYSQDMSFFEVVAIKAGTSVVVTPTCVNSPSTVPGQVPAMAGATTFVLNRGQVLHVESPALQNAYANLLGSSTRCSFSGTKIVASTAVGVFAGDNGALIQDQRGDLVFTQMLPDNAVGSTYVICSSVPSGTAQLDLIMLRSVSGTATVTFAVPLSTYPGPTDASPWNPAYIASVSTASVSSTTWTYLYMKSDTVVTSTSPIHILRFTAWATIGVAGTGTIIPAVTTGYYYPQQGYGDPSETELRPALEGSYDHFFYSHATFDNYLIVGAPLTSVLSIDGAPIPGTRSIPGTLYGCSVKFLERGTGGTHHLLDMTGNPITAQVQGLGLDSEYMYDIGSPPALVAPPPPPLAGIKWVPGTGCGPRPITFTDASVAGANPIVTWYWDFGDGLWSNDQNTVHTYATPGDYTVTEVVTDAVGFQAITQKVVTATLGNPCVLPVKPEDNGFAARPPHDGVDAGIAEGDVDGDGVLNGVDNCVLVSNADQSDLDHDGAGDVCDFDMDGDGVQNASDNCQAKPNPGQSDLDGNGHGDVCDSDMDGDTIPNAADNCPTVSNTGQADLNANQVGDACEVQRFVGPAGPAASAPVRSNPASVAVAHPSATAWAGLLLGAFGAAAIIALLLFVVLRRR